MLKFSSKEFKITTELKSKLATILVNKKHTAVPFPEVIQAREEEKEAQKKTIQALREEIQAQNDKIKVLVNNNTSYKAMLDEALKKIVQEKAPLLVRSLVTNMEKTVRDEMPLDSWLKKHGTFYNIVAEYVYKKYGQKIMMDSQWDKTHKLQR